MHTSADVWALQPGAIKHRIFSSDKRETEIKCPCCRDEFIIGEAGATIFSEETSPNVVSTCLVCPHRSCPVVSIAATRALAHD